MDNGEGLYSADSDISSLKRQMADLTSLVAQLVQTVQKPKKKATAVKKKKTPIKAKKKLDIPQETPIKDKPHIISLVKQKSTERVRGSQKGKQCRVEPMNIPRVRPNLFLKSDIAKSCKNDTKVDKLLNAGNTITERRPAARLYEVACKVCGGINTVSESMIMEDPDTGDFYYVCDSCIRSK